MEIEIDKKNLHLMLSILSFLLFLYKFYIEETKLSGYSEHDSAVDMLNQKFPLVVQVVHRGRGNERLKVANDCLHQTVDMAQLLSLCFVRHLYGRYNVPRLKRLFSLYVQLELEIKSLTLILEKVEATFFIWFFVANRELLCLLSETSQCWLV